MTDEPVLNIGPIDTMTHQVHVAAYGSVPTTQAPARVALHVDTGEDPGLTLDFPPAAAGQLQSAVTDAVVAIAPEGETPDGVHPGIELMVEMVEAARDVTENLGTRGVSVRMNTLRAALDDLTAADPVAAVLVAAACWIDRYGAAGAPERLVDLQDALEALDGPVVEHTA